MTVTGARIWYLYSRQFSRIGWGFGNGTIDDVPADSYLFVHAGTGSRVALTLAAAA